MTPRETLLAVATQLYEDAARMHAKGMTFVATSARIKQFANIQEDASVAYLLELLIEDGCVVFVDGVPVYVDGGDSAEPSTKLDIRFNAGGGEG